MKRLAVFFFGLGIVGVLLGLAPSASAQRACYSVTVTVNGETVVDEADCLSPDSLPPLPPSPV